MKKWLKFALIRALKTMAQTAVATITVGQSMTEIDWANLASVTAVAGILSILTSIAGIPEVEDGAPAFTLKGE